MLRNISGSLLALIGAVLAVRSPFRVWYGGRQGSDVRVADLFTGVGVTPADAALLGSLFLPLGFAALLALLGVLLRSRAAVGAAGLLVLGVTVLWMVRQAQAAGQLTAGGDGLDVGVAAAFGGGALLLLACWALPGRSVRVAGPDPASSAPTPPAPPLPPVKPVQPLQPPPVQSPPEPLYEPAYASGLPYAPGDAGAPGTPGTPAEGPYRPEDDDTLVLPTLPALPTLSGAEHSAQGPPPDRGSVPD